MDAPEEVERSQSTDSRCALFGSEWPKSEVMFLSQVVVLYTVIVVSIYNLTKGTVTLIFGQRF